jgi:fatty-acyl-CoA synthase
VHRRAAPEVGRAPAARGGQEPGVEPTKEELLAFHEGRIAKWWTPDDVVFVDAIPLGASGKMQKNKRRDPFRGHPLPTP